MPNRGMEHHKSAVFCQKALIPDWAKAMLDAAHAEAADWTRLLPWPRKRGAWL